MDLYTHTKQNWNGLITPLELEFNIALYTGALRVFEPGVTNRGGTSGNPIERNHTRKSLVKTAQRNR